MTTPETTQTQDSGQTPATPEYCHDPGGNQMMWQDLFQQWLTGTGPDIQYFRNGDPFTEMLRQHNFILQAKEQIALRISQGETAGTMYYSLGGITGPLKYVRDATTILCGGCYPAQNVGGNEAAAFLGSYSLEWRVVSNGNGKAVVEFHVTNPTTLSSGTRPPVLGYTDWWKENVAPPIDAAVAGGPMGAKYQSIRWTETIDVMGTPNPQPGPPVTPPGGY